MRESGVVKGVERRFGRFGVCGLFLALVFACVPGVPGGGDGADDGGDDGGGGENPPGMVTLDINIVGLTGAEAFSQVAYFVGDAIRDSHDNAGAQQCTKFDTAPASCRLQIESGKTVTMFGIDSISGSIQNFDGPVSTEVPANAVEFVRATGDCDSNPEPHACAVTMDENKSVTFEYRRMNSVLIQLMGFPRLIQIGITGDTPDTYGIPSFPDGTGSLSEFPAGTTSLSPVLKLYAKTGTTYAFSYVDWMPIPGPGVAESDFSRFLRWGGDCAGGNLVPGEDTGTTDCIIELNGVDVVIEMHFEYFVCGGNTSTGSTDIGCVEPPSCHPVPDRDCYTGPTQPVGPSG